MPASGFLVRIGSGDSEMQTATRRKPTAAETADRRGWVWVVEAVWTEGPFGIQRAWVRQCPKHRSPMSAVDYCKRRRPSFVPKWAGWRVRKHPVGSF